MHRKASLAPLRDQPFRVLLTARVVNELAYWFGAVALAVLVYDETNSALATAALFLGMEFLPAFVAPAVVARVELVRTRIGLPVLYALEAAAFGAIALTAGDFRLPLIVLLAAIDGTLALSTRALTRATAAAWLLPRRQLREGNALLNVGATVSAASGPALAGVVVAGSGVETPFMVAAVLLLLVAATLAAAGSLPHAPTAAEAGEPLSLRRRLREGLAFVTRGRVLRALFAAQAIAYVFFTAVLPIEVVFVKEALGEGDSAYGALLTSWGGGMVLGSLLFATLTRLPLWLPLLVSTLAIGGSYLALGASGTIVAACAAAAVGGLGNGVQAVALVSAVQEVTEPNLQARVLGLLEAVGSITTGVGFLLGGVIAATLDSRAAFLVAGGGVLLVTVFAAVALRRAGWSGARPATVPEPPALSPLERNAPADSTARP